MDSTFAKWTAVVAAVLAVVVALCWWSYQMGRDDRADTIAHLQLLYDGASNDFAVCQEKVGRLAPAAQIEPAVALAPEEPVPNGEVTPVEDTSTTYSIQATVTQELPLSRDVSLAVRRIYREGERHVADVEVRTPRGVETKALGKGEAATISGLQVRLVELDATQVSLIVDLGAS